MSDWRVTNQHKYLDGAVLVWDVYPQSGLPDHAHCEFCLSKFPSEVKAGYRTQDHKHWICGECFADFEREFHWKTVVCGN